MEISIGSFKFRLEILILIVIVFWIMCGHMLCGCSRVSLMEGLAQMRDVNTSNPGIRKDPQITGSQGGNNQNVAAMVAASRYQQGVTPEDTNDPRLNRRVEGFVGSNNMAGGPEFAGAQSSGYIMNPSKWAMPTLTYSQGSRPDAGVQAIWDRPKQPIPLPEGQLDMFATTDFKPSCCPNAYSNSTGCACMSVDQYNYLRERGSNNVPYSEY
jgi:hypothetical protein